jgi:hypothetical protein
MIGTNARSYVCKIKTPRGKPCRQRHLVSEMEYHKMTHKRARVASKKGISSESAFEKWLRRKYPKSLIFKTGTEPGVPDFALWHDNKLSFWEVKPDDKEKDSLLRPAQFKWIKDNCFRKKCDVYIVHYKEKNGKFSFRKKLLDRKNIMKHKFSGERK